ncbi:hypothetical protein M378DRAFT_9430 [Amanita muscaria Koide BX008]|uniref:Decapping nuclease n=1 Tax=Amanita muscaria (strain Koide BX008) TaxID=946122 RepID=A0A0C2XDZ8_AMAMK|nr:hypothetical protein M378DRAFT_9430 [Amanita muscaria Koide BX008]
MSSYNNEDPAAPTLLPYPDTSRTPTAQIQLQQPVQLTSFSYSENREFEFSDSALRYYVDPPPGARLDFGFSRWIRRPEDKGRIDSLLRAYSRAKRESTFGEIGVVSWRGVMTKILTAPYEARDGWELNVMFVNGTMYFEEHLSDEQLRAKNNMTHRQSLMCYYGYAFESYCTSPTPTRTNREGRGDPAGWGGDINTNVQWCSVVKSKIGNIRVVIGGEVDCVRGKYTGQPDTFVELKTSQEIRNEQDAARFEKKLLKFYFQSFLLGVPNIVVGFRTHTGVLSALQQFQTVQLPRLVRGKPGAWNPMLCFEWGNELLSFIKSAIEADIREGVSADSVWRASFVPGKGVLFRKLDQAAADEVSGGEDRIGFLPSWYWRENTGEGQVVGRIEY